MKFTTKIAALAAVTCLALTGCTSKPDNPGTEPGESTSSYNFLMLPKNLGNPYFDASNNGAKDAAVEFGGNLNYTGPSGGSGSGESQVSFVTNATKQGMDALILSANDPEALCDAVKGVQAAGVKVITFDADTTCRDLFVNQAAYEEVARTLVEMMVAQIGDTGEVAWLSAGSKAHNQNEWMRIANEIFAAEHPGITIVGTFYGNDNDQQSFDRTAAILDSHPSLVGIISPTAVGLPAAARYIQGSEFAGKVALTGLSLPSLMKDYVSAGTVTQFALWNPGDLGYLSTFAAKALINGEITGAKGDTFEAGTLGTIMVGDNATVILGPVQRFTAENINDFDF
ncbi:MAG: substrate-binding domain-containing protein [Propionibacteriaceae bacterium]|jgi:rhamnose transport system substrate-binding protein|nr:substrate-binding domain-containing protein [Propionibacteriaceae bacterium]